MEFRDATDGIPAARLAAAFRVSAQTIRQYRLGSSSSGHRAAPTGWRAIVAGILLDMGDEFHQRAQLLADQLDAG